MVNITVKILFQQVQKPVVYSATLVATAAAGAVSKQLKRKGFICRLPGADCSAWSNEGFGTSHENICHASAKPVLTGY